MSGIKDAIMILAGTKNKDVIRVYVGEVDSVDVDERSCSINVLSADAEYILPDCMLSAGDGDGFIKIPAIGSDVLVIETVRSGRYVLMTSDLDQVLNIAPEVSIESGNATVKVSDNGKVAIDAETSINGQTTVNNGLNGGVPTSLSIATKLNALELKINVIIAAISAAPVVAGDGGASFKTAVSAAIVGNLPLTIKTQLENSKFKH